MYEPFMVQLSRVRYGMEEQKEKKHDQHFQNVPWNVAANVDGQSK